MTHGQHGEIGRRCVEGMEVMSVRLGSRSLAWFLSGQTGLSR